MKNWEMVEWDKMHKQAFLKFARALGGQRVQVGIIGAQRGIHKGSTEIPEKCWILGFGGSGQQFVS